MQMVLQKTSLITFYKIIVDMTRRNEKRNNRRNSRQRNNNPELPPLHRCFSEQSLAKV